MNKELVVVLGMHRSGTSLLTKAIIELGYYSGDTMIAAKGDNKKGFFENEKIVQLNDKILSELLLNWKQVDITYINRAKTFLPLLKEKYFTEAVNIISGLFSNSKKCVLKDPRISILIPFWEEVFKELSIDYKYILSVRNPLEVSKSLVARGDVDFEDGVLLWLYYNTLIIKNLKNTVCTVDYKEFFEDSFKVMQKLCEYLMVNYEDRNESIEKFCKEFFEKKLKHQSESNKKINSLVSDIYYNIINKNISLNELKKNIKDNEEKINKKLGTLTTQLKNEYAQIYFDVGNGFTEDNSKKIYIDSCYTKINIDVSNYSDINSIRIDPLVDKGLVIIEEICVNGKDETVYLEPYTSNSIYENENVFILPYDGQLYFNNVVNNITQINIFMYTIPLDTITITITKLIQDLSILKTTINNLDNELTNKELHIKNIQLGLQEKEVHIKNVEEELGKKEVHIKSVEEELGKKEVHIKSVEEELDKKEVELNVVQKTNDNLIVQLHTNTEILNNHYNTTLLINRKKEEIKYILKYPFRILRKVVGFFIHPRVTIEFYRNLKFVDNIDLLDKQYYINNIKDYKVHKYNALEHFIRYGWNENRKPNVFYVNDIKSHMYSDSYYHDREMYKKIKKSKFFDANYYRKENEDIPNDVDLVWHFMKYGWKEGREPSTNFSIKYYLDKNPDLVNANVNPLYHYIQYGYYEKRECSSTINYDGLFYNLKAKMYKIKSSEYDLTLRNVLSFVKNNGIKKSISKAKSILNDIEGRSNVYEYTVPLLTENIMEEVKNFIIKPKISIIMPVYNVDPKWLELAIKSVENQWYDNWEICIVDDCSTNKKTLNYLRNIKNEKIKIKYLDKNSNISVASNEALTLCTGEYVGLMDNDDEITVDALYEVVKKINEGFTFIYSDEDKIDMNYNFCEPHFKADFSRDMLNSQNYISHFTVIKKSHLDKVKGFTVGLEGSQDYDLYLKIFDMCKDEILVSHIPKVLYHWRKIEGSTASEFSEKSFAQENGRLALENSIKRQQIKAKAYNGDSPGTYRIDYGVIGEPLVSIVIPFKDAKDLLSLSVASILEKSTYKNFEIIGMSNNSELEETFFEMARLEKLDKRVKFYEYNEPFNYSAINNYAVNNYTKGEYIVLLNNDIEILTENWIELMLGFAQRENTGAIGAKLYYPDDTIQHAGVIIGLGGVAGHSHKYFNKNESGYFYRPHIIQNLSAVTAACLMVSKEKYLEIEGLNEKDLKIAFNDVDFCLRLQEKGYSNVYTPYVEAYHYESVSRGLENTPAKIKRFNSEVEYIKKRHKKILKNGDPYYNVNLTLDREDFSLCK